ncbi:hypothetical protein Leryth_027573 [Lithospermum erythrorhizon]|nr:hypothetical protein Leryth_027573 [Lithospermum erythrorhizon]
MQGFVGHFQSHFQYQYCDKLCSLHSIAIACLLETKLSKTKVGQFTSSRFPGWGSCTNNDFIDGGRMLILWDGSRVIVILAGLILGTSPITCKVTQVSFIVTFVYPVYCIVERRKLWDHLTLVGSSLTLPWIVAGDFNCYSSSNDKVGGVLSVHTVSKISGDFRMAAVRRMLHHVKALKPPLKALNRDEFGSIFEKAKEANVAFKEAVQAHMDDPLNVTLKLKCHELRERANFLLENLAGLINREITFFALNCSEVVSILLVDFSGAFGSWEVRPIDESVVTNGYILSTTAIVSTAVYRCLTLRREALYLMLGNERLGPGWVLFYLLPSLVGIWLEGMFVEPFGRFFVTGSS